MPSLITPLVPPDVDLRHLSYVPIIRIKLFNSAFHARATGDEWRAGMLLWLKCWEQQPAGSLPCNDAELSRLAELDRSNWRAVKKMALHGWIRCADGRLYHRTIAELVTNAWQRTLAARHRTEAATAARLQSPLRQRNVNVTSTSEGGRGEEREGEERKVSSPYGSETSSSNPNGFSPRPRARRKSPVEKLWEGSFRAAEAVEARDAQRARSNGHSPPPALLDSGRSVTSTTGSDRGLDRGSQGVPDAGC